MIINLTQGKVCVIDDQDYEIIRKWKWYAQGNGGNFYARTNVTTYVNGERKQLGLQMHKLIMSPPPSYVVDHIDGDGLNNTRKNLRLVLAIDNRKNSTKRKGKSPYKGVTKSSRGVSKPWTASIRINKKLHYLGRYACQIDAARAYDKAAQAAFGEFARCNFIGKFPIHPAIEIREHTKGK
jgi:hypothetical protein